MGGDDDMMPYMAFLVPFNEFDRGDQADKRGLNPDLLAKFPLKHRTQKWICTFGIGSDACF